MRRIRPISHEDRLSVVDHLDELRSRLIFCVVAFCVAWAFTGWQNHLVLEIMNSPLPTDDAGNQIKPITLGPAEGFSTTLMNAAYFALIIAAPVILYQIYAFILPAFSPRERRVATPLLILVPVLFIAGVVFCYFVVLTPALHFLLNFNSDEFNTQVRAKDYYSFVSLIMLTMGIGFQIPVGILAACKIGVTNVDVAAPQPPLRDRGDRRPRLAPADARPRHADARVGSVLSAVRAQHPARGSLGQPRLRDPRRACGRGSVAQLALPRRMLFDLRGRRRRAVQATYLMLAVLMGGGLVLFGIGGDVSGGLLDAFKGGGGGSNGDSALRDQAKRQEERLAKNPQNPAVLQNLVRDYYSLATAQRQSGTIGFPADAKDELRKSGDVLAALQQGRRRSRAADTAVIALQVYDVGGLNRPKEAQKAAALIAQDSNDVASYLRLVQYAARAGDTRTADLAAKKAVDLAPKAQRKEVQKQAEALKKPPPGQPAGG